MAEKKTIKDLLADEIKDLYSAEKQLTKAIPKMAKGSTDQFLKDAFLGHLKETQSQVTRLEEIAGLLEIKPTGKNVRGWRARSKKAPKLSKKRGTRISSIWA